VSPNAALYIKGDADASEREVILNSLSASANMPPAGRLKLSAKSFLLTYPQCDVPKADLLAHLVQILDLWSPTIRVGHELHQDGNSHHHAYIRLARKLEKSNGAQFFDFRGHHPNIIPNIRSPAGSLAYVSKDGDFIDHGQFDVREDKPTWKEVVQCDNKEDFLEKLKFCSPRDYVINTSQIDTYVQKTFKPVEVPYVGRPRDSFDTSMFPDLQLWVDQTLNIQVRFHRLAKASP